MMSGKPHLIREYNLSIITSIISEKGPITKPEIAAATHLSLPTINKLVDELEEHGTVKTGNSIDGGIGRRAKTYLINESSAYFIVLYYQGNGFYASLCDIGGKELSSKKFSIKKKSLRGSLSDIYQVIDGLSKGNKEKIQAIGMGIPGVINNEGYIASIPEIPYWDGIQIGKIIEERYKIPTFLENDVKLMTVGYYSKHLKKKYSSIAFLYAGRGLGSGIIIDKQLVKGFNCFAGEYGYMLMNDDTNFEDILRREYRENEPNINDAMLLNYFVKVIINYITVINPEAIILKGDYISSEFIKKVKKNISIHIPSNNIPELLLDTEERDGWYGAYRLCLSNVSKRIDMVRRMDV